MQVQQMAPLLAFQPFFYTEQKKKCCATLLNRVLAQQLLITTLAAFINLDISAVPIKPEKMSL